MTSTERPIGRRAFLGLMVAGVVAFVFGRDAYARMSSLIGAENPAPTSVYIPEPIDLSSWRLKVEGLVQKPLKLSWDDFLALPRSDETADFACITGWRVQPRQWSGIRLRELLDRAGVEDDATHVVFHSADAAYTDSLTVADARSDDVLLAHASTGELLTHEHGRPVRLVTPGRWGYKYVKWITKIEVIAAGPEGYQGYWETRGYSADAWIE